MTRRRRPRGWGQHLANPRPHQRAPAVEYLPFDPTLLGRTGSPNSTSAAKAIRSAGLQDGWTPENEGTASGYGRSSCFRRHAARLHAGGDAR